MNLLIPPLPPFRIEAAPLSASGDPAKAPWTFFGTASTESQGKQKIESLLEIHPEYIFRSVPNEWQTENLVALLQEKLGRNEEFRQSVIRQCGSDDIDFLADAVFLSKAAEGTIADLKSQLADVMQKLSELAPKPEAISGASPDFPFGPGDNVRDIFTDRIVRVTAVGANATKGNGFDWILEEGEGTGQTGHCPIESVGCFEPTKKKSDAHAHKAKAPHTRKAPRAKKRAHAHKTHARH